MPESFLFNSEEANSHPQELKPIERIELGESPILFDVKGTSETFFPEGKYLRIANGNEYILDETGKTILLFEKKRNEGFGSVYTPLTISELKTKLARLPEQDRKRLYDIFGISDDALDVRQIPVVTRNQATIARIPIVSSKKTAESTVPEKKQAEARDLPEDHFLELSERDLQEKKQAQWEAVKDLDDNDPRKIVYFRRFTREFKSSVSFNPELTAQSSDNFRYYAPDITRMESISSIEPYQKTVEIPEGIKIGFVIGYHHLEKPWGRLFMDMLQKQIDYNPDQIEFILIGNKEIPTGDQSPASEREIKNAVKERGITHLIDVHEQLATLNHYMDSHFEPNWREGVSKNPNGQEYTFDPFVPTWMIEQYYQGNIYPQLQHAINDQLGKVVRLIEKMSKKE